MAVYKDNRPTKDGKIWFFKTQYEDFDGTKKPKKSGRFATKKEAEQAELEFKISLHEKVNHNEITFEEMIELFLNFKKKRVRETTYYNYGNKIPYLKPLFKIKLKDFNYSHFERWHDYMDYETTLATRTKNDIYKFLRSILNFGVKWNGFNFNNVYNKMTKFQDPNERRKEMSYYNYEEFKKFISYEDDLRWKCVFEIFYYCGLRKGELKGLTWKDIYFDKKVLSVNKQITQLNNRTKFEFSDTKTKDSYRIVPITKVLLNDLKMLYEQSKKEYCNFNDDFFVVSDARPISDTTIYDRRTLIANKAGLKSIRLHDFRHSCASLLINNGANVTLVAKFLGYTKIEETLNTYSHMFSTALDNIVSIIDNLE